VVKKTDVYYYLRVKERYAAQGGGTACGERLAAKARGTGGGRSCGLAVMRSCGHAVLRSCSLAVMQSLRLLVLNLASFTNC
jgi:hypothetical protein